MPTHNNGLLNWHDRIGYGSGDYALNLFWQGVGFYLFFYYTDVLGIPNRTAGLIFVIGGIWDAFSDPVMGYIAERTKSKWGSYRPYLIFGSIPLALSFILLFTPPVIDEPTGKSIYLLIILLIFRTCYTVVSIPYSALSACLTHDSKERTRISGIRMYCGFLGGITVVGLAAFLQFRYDDVRAFSYLAYICAILSVLTLVFCFKNTKEETPFELKTKPAASMKALVFSITHNKPFILLMLAIIFITIATTFLGKNLLYYFQYVLNSRTAGNTAIALMTGLPLITIPFWSAIALKYGKKITWVYGGMVSGFGFTLIYIDQSKLIHYALIEFGIVSFGISSFAVLLWSMLPDTIDYGEYHTGIRNESIVVGILSSAQKIALALTAYSTGFILDYIGYKAGLVQASNTLDNINMIVSILPLIAISISVFIVILYPLSGDILSKLREKNYKN